LIHNIKYIIGNHFDPYYNLALEEYLLKHVKKGECILYLWQNEKTVVIGRNQNPWKECKLQELEDFGGKLVRRLSGGGAVFHDLGNLNFTFLMNKEDYDLTKQQGVIVKAVNHLNIPAVINGRNDITVDERKFSGNAFYTDGENSYHHGTILVKVNMGDLSKYLNVSKDKLISKGVESVKSRVVNLTEYDKNLTIDIMKNHVIRAFEEVYGLTAQELDTFEISVKELKVRKNRFSSWEWNLGKKLDFDYKVEERYPWGNVEVLFRVDKGMVRETNVYSDSLDTDYISSLTESLQNCKFSSDEIIKRIEEIDPSNELQNQMAEDLISMIRKEAI
jgi:lipoate-protein ligase A